VSKESQNQKCGLDFGLVEGPGLDLEDLVFVLQCQLVFSALTLLVVGWTSGTASSL